MLAGPVSVQFVPSAHGTSCPEGRTESWCVYSGPSPPPSPPLLPELCPHPAKQKQDVKLKDFTGSLMLIWIEFRF